MLLMIRRVDTVNQTALADGGEVRMKFHHQVAGRNRFRAIDLDFVVALREKRRGAEETHGRKNDTHAIFQNSA
jgi:hypothetical protein